MDAIARAFVEVGLRDNGLRQGMVNVRNEMAGVQTAAARLVPGIGALQNALSVGLVGGTVLAGAGLAKFAFEAAQSGAQLERLSASFGQVWGQLGESSEAALLRLRAASRGTISDTNLMLAANRAAFLGVATSTEQLGQLMEIAAFRGRAMGLSMTQAFNDIVTGIGRASPLILDNLGIVIDQAAANEEYARSLGRTANSLSETEKKQVLLNAVLRTGAREIEAAGGVASDAAEDFEALTASWDNLLKKIGSGQILPIVSGAAGEFSALLNLMGGGSWEQAILASGGNYKIFQKMQEDFLNNVRNSRIASALADALFAGTGQSFEEAMGRIDFDRFLSEYERLAGAQIDMMAHTQEATAEQLLFQVELSRSAQEAAFAAEAIDIYGAALRDLNPQEIGNMAAAAINGIRATVAEAIAAAQLTYAEGAALVAQAELKFGEMMNGMQPGMSLDPLAAMVYFAQEEEAIRGRIRAVEDGRRAQERAARASASAWESEMNRIRGVVEGVLRPTFAGDPTNILDSMGLHIDTADEDARRMASVMAEGLSSQWTQYFASRGLLKPEDLVSDDSARAASARLLREFQLGLRPELVDKETAKQRVREILLGRERTDQLVNEIMQELGAEGVRASRQQVRLALGDTTAATESVGGQTVSVNVAPVTVQAAVQLSALTAAQVNAWAAEQTGIFFQANPLLAQPTTQQRLDWILNTAPLHFQASPLLATVTEQQRAMWILNTLPLSFQANPLLARPSEQQRLAWLLDVTGVYFQASPLLARPTAESIAGWTQSLATAINTDLLNNADTAFAGMAGAEGRKFALDMTAEFAKVPYVSPLVEAMNNDFGANFSKLDVPARAIGQYVGVIISDEIKKNTSIVQSVVNAAITELANAMIDASREGGQ